VGAPFDLDQLSEAAMFRDSRYVAARAKIDVTKKMVDRVKLDLKNSESVTAYVFLRADFKNLHLLWLDVSQLY